MGTSNKENLQVLLSRLAKNQQDLESLVDQANDITFNTCYVSTIEPTADEGNDGDLWLVVEG